MSISEMKAIYDRLTELERRVAVLTAALDEATDQRRKPKASPVADAHPGHEAGPVRLGQTTVRLGGS